MTYCKNGNWRKLLPEDTAEGTRLPTTALLPLPLLGYKLCYILIFVLSTTFSVRQVVMRSARPRSGGHSFHCETIASSEPPCALLLFGILPSCLKTLLISSEMCPARHEGKDGSWGLFHHQILKRHFRTYLQGHAGCLNSLQHCRAAFPAALTFFRRLCGVTALQQADSHSPESCKPRELMFPKISNIPFDFGKVSTGSVTVSPQEIGL